MKPSIRMKRLLYLLIIFFAFGCKDDADDFRSAAVGKYTTSATYYVLKGGILELTDSLTADPVTISIVSGVNEILIDFGDGDFTTGINLKSSTDGFTFELHPFVGSGIHFTGYAGYESDGSHYDGGFAKTGRKMELWYQYTFADKVKVIRCSMVKQ